MIKQKCITILMIIVSFVLQTTFLHSIELADVVPNLLLILTVSYAYMRGRTSGLAIGFLCGILLDMMYGSVIGVCTFGFINIGYWSGYLQKIYFTDRFSLPLFLVATCDLLYGMYYYFTEFLIRGRLNFGFSLIHKIIPEMVYTTLVSIVILHFLMWLEPKISKKREEV